MSAALVELPRSLSPVGRYFIALDFDFEEHFSPGIVVLLHMLALAKVNSNILLLPNGTQLEPIELPRGCKKIPCVCDCPLVPTGGV